MHWLLVKLTAIPFTIVVTLTIYHPDRLLPTKPKNKWPWFTSGPHIPTFVYSKISPDIRTDTTWNISNIIFLYSSLPFSLHLYAIYNRINRIRVHWYWNLYSGVLENCLWASSKMKIWIFFPCRFVEGRGEGAGWVFILYWLNWLL